MLRHQLITVLVSTLAGCIPPATSQGYVLYVPVVPLVAYPPAPYATGYEARYAGAPGYPGDPSGDPVYLPPPAQVDFQTPSLAVRALAGKISETASNGDCDAARSAGNELERMDAESHHAILAIDERYAQCVRGF